MLGEAEATRRITGGARAAVALGLMCLGRRWAAVTHSEVGLGFHCGLLVDLGTSRGITAVGCLLFVALADGAHRQLLETRGAIGTLFPWPAAGTPRQRLLKLTAATAMMFP